MVFPEALALHRGGDFAQAEAAYRQLLEQDADDVNALHFLGVLHHQTGRGEAAVNLIRQALELAPDYRDAWNNLGNILKEQGRYAEAEEAYRQTLELAPEHADAWNNLGVVLRAQELDLDAIDAFKRAAELEPNNAAVLTNFGNLAKSRGLYPLAAACYHRALANDPSQFAALHAYGYVLYRSGFIEEAAQAYRQLLEREPDNAVARHMLAACSGEDVPERCASDYVRQVFDQFADSFDAKLVDRLHYQAPQLLTERLAAELGEPKRELAMADLGCGTGLCGPLWRPWAARLEGVDLSAGMLAKARARGCYDALHEADLHGWLDAEDRPFDVLASADTLLYFGALDGVFASARRRLKPGGWLAFSVEALDDEARDFHLQAHGRYCHSRRYLLDCLERAGFGPTCIESAQLRTEADEPVMGWLVLAQAQGV
ncbi:MAG: tetratricopeptide repeat protein [Gammaproteobacteria bacterium]|nr:tetratricopeptide repeat protein [Gammaproteobacteria bacterium]